MCILREYCDILGKVEAELLKYLERCVAASPLSLETLCKIEAKLVQDFQLKHFEALKSGPFLRFLTRNSDVKNVCCAYHFQLLY